LQASLKKELKTSQHLNYNAQGQTQFFRHHFREPVIDKYKEEKVIDYNNNDDKIMFYVQR